MKKKKKVVYLIIITILLELFIFNFRFFSIQFSGTKKEKISDYDVTILQNQIVQDEESENEMSEDEIIEETSEDEEIPKINKQITIDLNKAVESIKLNFDKIPKDDVRIAPSFTDEGEKYSVKIYNDYIYNKSLKGSEYIALNSQGKCDKLYLLLSSTEDFNLKDIEINTWYYNFNILRVLLIIAIGILVIYWYDINKFFENRRKMRILVYTLLVTTSIIVYGIFAIKWQQNEINNTDDGNIRFRENNSKIHVDPYNFLTESILNGRIDLNYPYEGTYITDKEIEELSNLNNTKDISEREVKRIQYYFDTAFYNGKYYCYYGIVPVLTVMLPIAILTGNIVFSYVPCFIYGSLLMIIILLIYLEILKKLKIKLNFTLEVLLYITLFLSTGISIFMTSLMFYQAADMCGLFWGFLGIYLILKMDNNKKMLTKLLFSGISFGLMVCSRPIYVLYFPIYVILILKHIIQKKKINIKRLLYFSIPIAIIAILQMIYNYARFDNIFEFGQFWQLTINDPSQQDINVGMSINGLMIYLFSLPTISNTFPYLNSVYRHIKNGNLIYTEGVYGLICYPFLWSMIWGWKQVKENKKLKYLWLTIIIIMVLFFSLNTCLAGMNQRYTVDIQPCLAIMSLVIWLLYLKKYNTDKRSKKTLVYICITTCVISMLITLSRTVGITKILGIHDGVESIKQQIENIVFFYK